MAVDGKHKAEAERKKRAKIINTEEGSRPLMSTIEELSSFPTIGSRRDRAS